MITGFASAWRVRQGAGRGFGVSRGFGVGRNRRKSIHEIGGCLRWSSRTGVNAADGGTGGARSPWRDVQPLADFDDRTSQAVCLLEVSDFNAICLTDVVKRITLFNDVRYPTWRSSAWDWSVRGYRWDIDACPGGQAVGIQTIGLAQFGTADLENIRHALEGVTRLDVIQHP